MSKMSRKPSLAELQQKIGELTEALQRERADAINLRRRVEEERQQLSSFYKAMVVRELLPALDELELALKHIPDHKTNHSEIEPWKRGIGGVVRRFEDCLAKLGVERIKTVGEPFDPRFHEAISMEDAGGKHEVISEELKGGYILGDEVIRHAMVRVRRGDKNG